MVKETNATTGNITDYLYGDDLIRQSKAANDSYYLYDGLGSTRALTNSAGTITDTYNYESFGTVLNQTGATPNDYLFTGEQYDSGLDNYYLRARYFDQNIGRFTQQDTYMGNSQDPVSLHKYLYANVYPVNNIDPSGNFSLSSLGSSINVIGTLVSRAQFLHSMFELATGDEELSAKQIGFEILAGVGGGKLIKMFSKKFKPCKVKNSFVEGTLVSTADGYLPIEKINIGALILSYEENTGTISEQEVVHLIQGHKYYDIVVISFEDGSSEYQ